MNETFYCCAFTRCPYEDDRYLTTLVPVGPSYGLQYPTHYRRFVVKMFTFVDKDLLMPKKEQVCLLILGWVCVYINIMCISIPPHPFSSTSTVVQLCASSQPQSPVNQAVIGQVS